MNVNVLAGLLTFLVVALPFVQYLQFKKKYVGYKSIQDAVKQESEKLAELKREQEVAVGLRKDADAALDTVILKENEAQATFQKLQVAIVDLEKVIQRMHSELIEVKNELALLNADLLSHRGLQAEISATTLQLTQEKNSLELRIAHLIDLELRGQALYSEIDALARKSQQEQSKFDFLLKQRQVDLQSAQVRDALKNPPSSVLCA